MATELLACPFCGSKSVQRFTRTDNIFSWVYCGPCGAQGPVEAGSPDDGTPEERWNRRATAKAEESSGQVIAAFDWRCKPPEIPSVDRVISYLRDYGPGTPDTTDCYMMRWAADHLANLESRALHWQRASEKCAARIKAATDLLTTASGLNAAVYPSEVLRTLSDPAEVK